MNNLVSFEIAKLLKEKGFDENTRFGFNGAYAPHHLKIIEFGYLQRNSELLDTVYSAPTIAEVVMWVYEKHGIWISVEATDDFTMFCFRVRKKEISRLSFNYNTPIEAYEEAIKYTLNNLI